jgi:hypothetical protein
LISLIHSRSYRTGCQSYPTRVASENITLINITKFMSFIYQENRLAE